MQPEDVVVEIVTTLFRGSQVDYWPRAAHAQHVFRFRIVAGAKVWSLDRAYDDEMLNQHPDEVAKEFVREIRHHMEAEMRAEWTALYEEVVEEYKKQRSFISPFTGAPMAGTGYDNDGWFDTDKRHRENARLLELARIQTQHDEEEKAKASILDAIATRAMRDTDTKRRGR